MSDRRSAETTPEMADERQTTTRDLAWLSEERMISNDSAWWPRIARWQRQGLVRLRWGESRLYCFVQLTDKGRDYVHG